MSFAASRCPSDESPGVSAVPVRICMLVFNDFTHDSRVLREARTLVRAGYEVRVVALMKNGLPGRERVDGFTVLRVALDPWHLRLLRRLRNGPARTGRWSVGRLARVIKRGLVQLLRIVSGVAVTSARALRHAMRATTHLEHGAMGGVRRLWRRGVSAFRRRAARLRAWLIAVRRRAAVRSRTAARELLEAAVMPWHRVFCYVDFYRRVNALGDDRSARVYHAHDLNTLPIACWLGRGHGTSVVYDSHELYVDRNRLPPRSWAGRLATRWLESVLVARVDGVITVNDSIAEVLARRYRISRPIVVMNAPEACAPVRPETSLDLRALCGASSRRRLVLYAGGITFNRGLPALIASLVHLPSCHLVLMGYGPPAMLDQLGDQARTLGVNSRVSILDPVPPDQVASYAASADIGVAPIENACLSYFLCSPNKLFEYLHAGLPVAASDFPELRKVIEQHGCGRTFDPSDSKSIADCISEILDNPRRHATMRHNARVAAEHFTWAIEGAKLVACYDRILGET